MVDRLVQVSAKDRIYDRRQFEYQTDFKLLACKKQHVPYCICLSFHYSVAIPDSSLV